MLLFKRFSIIAFVIFLTEVIIFLYDERVGLLCFSIPIFLIRFLIIPSVFNIIVLVIGYLLLKSERYSETFKNITICMVCFFLCVCVELTHYVFVPVLCAPVIAIYISITFGNIKITRLLTVLSIISLILAGIISAVELRAGDKELPFEIVVAIIITVCSDGIASLLIQRERERMNFMLQCYQKQTELSEQLNRDTLTGLYNRKVMFDVLHGEIEQGNLVYLAVLDIDNFKVINDTYGHAKGDEVLLYLSKLFKKYVNRIGYPIRFGGEEFAIIFSNLHEENVIAILEKIRTELLNHTFVLAENGQITHITISSGLVRHRGLQSIEELFKSADRAMYQAKKRGKNNIVYVRG
ncbi:GGDEF domain-containing protein [Anaerosacchariphilus polymeriproducens]|nr:GGDEF domain-containing protein [Anaerosacchariphilus polymeriproducens]